MRCFHPWKPSVALGLAPTLRLPCNQCVGCRLRRSAEWATRCMHEVKQHRYNTWVTLTYDDEHLPQRYYTGIINPHTGKKIYSGSLQKIHIQKFIRALRKTLSSKRSANDYTILFEYQPSPANMGLRPIPLLRYYYAGEYGEKYNRPHYHACLFGIEFNDKKHIKTTAQGFDLYESKRLQQLWTYGQSIIGTLNWQTAAYTARYIMKKITGKNKTKQYTKTDQETGEIIITKQEFNDMSRKPGIGKKHYDKYKQDIYKKNESYVRVKGKKTKPPRYYDKQYTKDNANHMQHIVAQRRLQANKLWRNTTPQRLKAEEQITISKIKTLKQKL